MTDLIEQLRDKTRLRAAHGLTGWVLAEESLCAGAADMIAKLRTALTAACEIVQSERVRLYDMRERTDGLSSVYWGRIALLDAVLRQADEALGVDVERPE